MWCNHVQNLPENIWLYMNTVHNRLKADKSIPCNCMQFYIIWHKLSFSKFANNLQHFKHTITSRFYIRSQGLVYRLITFNCQHLFSNTPFLKDHWNFILSLLKAIYDTKPLEIMIWYMFIKPYSLTIFPSIFQTLQWVKHVAVRTGVPVNQPAKH